ncbi:Plasmid stabilization system protein ParE [Lachnospiraceae bacterium]|nr:Plasmid stabilization system protein ParE [Lachnospiraceae bacterium]
MKKIVYSKVLSSKLKKLKQNLIDKFGEKTSVETLTKIMRDLHLLAENSELGVSISELYTIDTEYYYLFSSHNYFIYRIEADSVVIVNMFNEKEDFMLKLFGVSGRTQASIDYWGE